MNSLRSVPFPQVAPRLVVRGYRPVPITPGTKAPTLLLGWQKYVYSSADDQKFADCGTGILTGDVLGIDIDIPEVEVVKDLLTWLLKTYGRAPVRFGMKPKALMLYRAAQPGMTKRQTPTFKRGDLKASVEVLAKGQQMVAYAIHPGTKQPYDWYGGDPLTISVDKLPVLTDGQVSEIIEHCAARLAKWGHGPAPPQPASPELDAALFPRRGLVAAENDALIIQKPRATRAQLLRALADLAEYDQSDYDSWREVGQVLHYETGGSGEGLEIFIKYSRCLSGFYAGPEAGEQGCRTKWRSFGRSGAKPVTFGTLKHRLAALRRSKTGRKLELPKPLAANHIARGAKRVHE